MRAPYESARFRRRYKRDADVKFKMTTRAKFNTLNFAQLYCAIGAAAELKGEILSANFAHGRIYRAKFHAIAEL